MWAGGVAIALVLVAGCASGDASSPGLVSLGASPAPSPSTVPEQVDLTIFAAASLRDALDALKDAYAVHRPSVALTVATDSSAALATQILEGASADIFLSADEANPARLVDGGLADGPAIRFAANALTIVVPTGVDTVATPADLANPGVKIIAAGTDVPITEYGTQLIRGLARLPGYPPEFVTAYASNIVSREDNVKSVIAKVELGEGDAAIVYATDARASGKVDELPIPPAAGVRAMYAGVVLAGSDQRTEARAFMDWLTGVAGQAIVASLGFLPPES